MERMRSGDGAAVVGLVSIVLLVAGGGLAAAEDGWSVVVTPQVWLSHITDNGFGGPPSNPLPFNIAPENLTVTSQPASAIDPQWGLQIALQKGRWTFGIGAQYVSFETQNNIIAQKTFGLRSPMGAALVSEGQTVSQELVNTDRFDSDLSLTYFIPDVAKDLLDVRAGLGFKFIYASASRNFTNGVPVSLPPPSPPVPLQLLYFRNCPEVITPQNVGACQLRTQVPVDDFYYGATIPLSFNFYLTERRDWIVLFNVIPFIGAETRDDHNVVYATQQIGPSTFQVKKLDGTTFAYGATADLGVRYVFDNGIALYGGFRVQVFEGFEQYLAWGPMVNMSVRFGK